MVRKAAFLLVTAVHCHTLQVAVGEQKMDAVKQLGLSDEDVAAWRAQDAALTRLPEAMVSAFSSTERDFYTHSKVQRRVSTLIQNQPAATALMIVALVVGQSMPLAFPIQVCVVPWGCPFVKFAESVAAD